MFMKNICILIKQIIIAKLKKYLKKNVEYNIIIYMKQEYNLWFLYLNISYKIYENLILI